jgi:type II secretory pathway predicted ATPase ExeA
MTTKPRSTRRSSQRRATSKVVPPPLSVSQQAVVAQLSMLVAQRRPLAVIVGAPGIGKSRMAAALPNELHLRGPAREIHDGRTLSAARLLDSAAVALGIAPDDEETLQAVIDSLSRPLRSRDRARVVCIDDAHRLSAAALQALVQLIGCASQGHSRLCLVLLGEPQLASSLQRGLGQPSWIQDCVLSLGGLSVSESRAYAARRMGQRPPGMPVPTHLALTMIHFVARGVPARVGELLEDAGREAASRGATSVGLPTVLKLSRSTKSRAVTGHPATGPRASARKATALPVARAANEARFGWMGAAAGVALGVAIAHVGANYVLQPAQAASDSAVDSAAAPTFTLSLPVESDPVGNNRSVKTSPVTVPAVVLSPATPSSPSASPAPVRAQAPAPAVAVLPAASSSASTSSSTNPASASIASRSAADAPGSGGSASGASRPGSAVTQLAALSSRVPLPEPGPADSGPQAMPELGSQAASPASNPTRLAARSEASDEARLESSAKASRPEARIEKRPHGVRDDLAKAGDALAAGRNSEAIALLRKVLSVEPSNVDARANLLAVLAEREGREEWLAALAEAAVIDPARWAITAAQAHAEHGQHERAVAELETVPASSRDARYWSLTGLVQGKLDHQQASLEAWDRALALTPRETSRYHATQIARAVALERLGRADEAREIYQEMVATAAPPANVLSFARSRLVAMGLATTGAKPAQP